MRTPICDFVRSYAESGNLRLHMPGHKGKNFLGFEQLDITEISGADSLYEAEGIIAESEANAESLFGGSVFYSTEGCSQCIRAMVYLALLWGKQQGRAPVIAAARNAHRSFLSAAALLDLEILWLYPKQADSYLSCRLDAETLDRALAEAEQLPAAVYLTSPDYLGNLQDIPALAQVCHRYGVLLLVDNAHGAYLRFLQPSLHPMDLGADLCCDSAHKTLPVLTGGAYLHVADTAPALFREQAKNALLLFGSTSPSYLILQSLDRANAYLADGYPEKLAETARQLTALKQRLADHGYCLRGEEPLKLTLAPKSYGYTGTELSALLLEEGIVCEFADPDFLVLMATPETTSVALQRVEQVLLSIPEKAAVAAKPPVFCGCQRKMSVREAAMSPCETVPVKRSVGRVLASASVGCPPAVPVVVCGEQIDEAAVSCFRYYGIDTCVICLE